MNDRIFSIAHYVDQGVLYLLLMLCFFTLFMIAERYWYLKKKVKTSQKIQKEIHEQLKVQNYKVLEKISQEPSLEGQAIKLSLEHFKTFHSSGVEEIFKTLTQMEKPKLERYLGFLATVGSNGPYIGLFGTVLGIMKSFHEMGGQADGASGNIMAGISSALVATAAGLMVAIPAVLAYNFFSRQVKGILSNLDTCKEVLFLFEKTAKTGE
jgi:biopolymer transport protein ExbB